jgi:hypothetical protein
MLRRCEHREEIIRQEQCMRNDLRLIGTAGSPHLLTILPALAVRCNLDTSTEAR